MNTKELLKELCALPARSGHENMAAQAVRERFAAYCRESYVTPLYSVVGIRRCGRENAPLVLLDAHLDQIGYLVSGIEDGFLHLMPGYDRTPLPGKEMMVWGREPLYGVVAVMPPHLQKDSGKPDEYEHLVVDIGYSQERAEALVRPGDPVTYLPTFYELRQGRIASPAVDDRAGIAAMLLTLDALVGADLAVDVAVLASSTEETGGPGSATAAYGVKPDYAIALDVTFALQKGVTAEQGGLPEDGGVAIGRGPHLNRRLTEKLIALAEANSIPYIPEVLEGPTGTNASGIRAARRGVAAGLLSFPMRYMHSPVETILLKHIEDTAALLRLFLLSMKGGEPHA